MAQPIPPPFPAPGWYVDPWGADGQRYWDGVTWGQLAPGRPRRTSNRGIKTLAIVGMIVLAAGCLAYAVSDHTSPTMDEDNTYYRVTPENAGRYLTVGPRDGQECNWGRLLQPRQTVDSIIEVGTGAPGRNTTVTLRAGEYFISWGCRPWRKQ